MIYHTKPDWYFQSEGEYKVTDFWIDTVDPENEVGEEVTAHITTNSSGSIVVLGVFVESLEGIVALSRDAMKQLEGISEDQLLVLEGSIEREIQWTN